MLAPRVPLVHTNFPSFTNSLAYAKATLFNFTMTIHLRLSLRLDVSAKGQDWSGADGGPYSVYLAAGHIFGSRYLRVEVRRLGLAKNDLFRSRVTEKKRF